MYHRTRWTPEKIKQRLELISPLVYRNQKALPSFRVESAWEMNLLEENESEFSVENDSIRLGLKPYQIMTIRPREKA